MSDWVMTYEMAWASIGFVLTALDYAFRVIVESE